MFDFDVRKFFRRAPNDELQRYFAKQQLLREFDWNGISPRSIDPLYDAWYALDGDEKIRTGQDFLNLDIIGKAGGKTVIIDEAQFLDNAEAVAPTLAKLLTPLACAFWVYFEREDLWKGALFFAIADLKPKRRWRKRRNMPKLGRKPLKEDADHLASEVSEFFMRREARGAHCKVYPYRRGHQEYYFVYPQDHRSESNEFDDAGTWIKRPYNPAFEIIFVHDDDEQTLRVWHDGSMDRVKDLQVAFSKAVLNADIPRDSPKDERIYDLGVFRNSDFVFKPREDLGIERVEIRKMSIRTFGEDAHVTRIELDQETKSHVLHRRLETAMRDNKNGDYRISSVGMRVTFVKEKGQNDGKTRNFDLSWPNSSSLDDDEYGHRILQMLADHGIEPKMPKDDGADGDPGE